MEVPYFTGIILLLMLLENDFAKYYRLDLEIPVILKSSCPAYLISYGTGKRHGMLSRTITGILCSDLRYIRPDKKIKFNQW